MSDINEIDYTKHYSKWHQNNPNHEKRMIAFYSKILRGKLPENKQARILDIGCGMGFALSYLKSMKYENIAGLELDVGQAEFCKQKGLRVIQTKNPIDFLEKNHSAYDCCLLIDVLEHVPVDLQIHFLKAIKQSLSPKGILLLTVPNANSCIAGRWRYIDWTHTSSFTETSLSFVLENAGYSNIRIIETDIWIQEAKSFLSSFLRGICLRISRFFQRIIFIGELGLEEGMTIPLSVNIMAIIENGESKP